MTVNLPTAAAGDCAFVGATSSVGGVETAGVSGNLQVGSATAAHDKAFITKALRDKGRIQIDFSVLEVSARHYDVLSGAGSVLNASPILAEGLPAYSVSVKGGKGKKRGADTVVIRTTLGDKTTILSAPTAVTKSDKKSKKGKR